MQHTVAIIVAVIGAVLMSVGTQLQSSGVGKSRSDASGRDHDAGFSFAQLFGLLRSKRWVAGSAMLGAAILVQMVSLSLAPIMVVQPVGVVALVLTTVLNARIAHIDVGRAVLAGVAMCMSGIAAFVALSAFVARDQRVTDAKLLELLVVMAIVLALAGAAFWGLASRLRALAYIIGAGVLYGFVSTLAKVVIGRIQQGEFEWLTVACLAALGLAVGLGGWFVQNAHASGPPDLVMAGLTVIDPLVAVLLGMILLGEAQGAPLWTVPWFAVTGAIAVAGVFIIAKHHPQVAHLRG